MACLGNRRARYAHWRCPRRDTRRAGHTPPAAGALWWGAAAGRATVGAAEALHTHVRMKSASVTLRMKLNKASSSCQRYSKQVCAERC